MKCKCGSRLFFESTKVIGGWWKRLLDGDGKAHDTDIDNLRFGATPKTVICAECGRRNPNPRRGAK